MRTGFEPWRRRLRLWVLPLVFCALNAAAAALYQTSFAGNVKVLHRLVSSASEELAELQGERQESEAFLERVEARRAAMKELYEEHFSTAAQRFTTMVREAKRLARQAGLAPASVAYPENKLGDGALVERRMVFAVQGTYDQLRTFINFLELTDQFLTLESVGLSGSEVRGQSQILSIRLELSTVFVAEGSDQPTSGNAS